MPDALRFLILTAAGWVNRHQEDVIDYLREENRAERVRRTPWKAFLQAHWDGLAACDLFTVEVLTLAGLKRREGHLR